MKTIETLHESVQSLIDEHTPSEPGKKPNNTLIVTVFTETFCKDSDSVNTFLDVIDRIGIEDVKGLELLNYGFPLITTERIERSYKNQWDSICGKYLVYAYGNAGTKAKKLREISNGLGIDMTILVESPDGQQTEY